MSSLIDLLMQEKSKLQEYIDVQYENSIGKKIDYPCYIISGAGDSYAAGLILKHSFRQPAMIDSPLDLLYSNLLMGSIRSGCALIAISMGGRTKSLVELAKRYKNSGGNVIAVTSDRNSPLAKVSDDVIDIVYGKTIMYSGIGRQAVLITGLAAVFGKKRVSIEDWLEDEDDSSCPLFSLPETNVGLAGSLGTALFSTLKSYEFYGVNSLTISMEELMHAYIYGAPRYYNLFLPPQKNNDLLKEKISLIKQIGVRVNVIQHKNDYWQTMMYQTIKTINCLIKSVKKKKIDKPVFTKHNKLEELTRAIYLV